MAECGPAFGTPAIVGWEVREETPSLSKAWSPGGTRMCSQVLAKACVSRAPLEMRPEKKGKKEGRTKGERKEGWEQGGREEGKEKTALSGFHLHLLFPLPETLFMLISLCPAPSQLSGLCSNVTFSESPSLATPAIAMSACCLQSIIVIHHMSFIYLFTWLLSISTLWNVSFLKAKTLFCVHPSP